jgi:hypothetical protein
MKKKYIFLNLLINLLIVYVKNIDTLNENDHDMYNYQNNFDSSNKEFWDQIYQNSMLNTKTKYNALSGDKVCFSCPIDRNIFTSLYHEAIDGRSNGTPPRITISWATQLNENRVIFFCRNNTRIATNPVILSLNQESLDKSNSIYENDGSELDYSCENNYLCLINVKKSYPQIYQCFIKSYVLNVKLNVIGKYQFINFKYCLLNQIKNFNKYSRK